MSASACRKGQPTSCRSNSSALLPAVRSAFTSSRWQQAASEAGFRQVIDEQNLIRCGMMLYLNMPGTHKPLQLFP